MRNRFPLTKKVELENFHKPTIDSDSSTSKTVTQVFKKFGIFENSLVLNEKIELE